MDERSKHGAKTIKRTEENIRQKSHDTEHGCDILDLTEGIGNKRKKKKTTSSKFKAFYVSKGIIDRFKRQPTQNGRKYLQIIYLIRN